MIAETKPLDRTSASLRMLAQTTAGVEEEVFGDPGPASRVPGRDRWTARAALSDRSGELDAGAVDRPGRRGMSRKRGFLLLRFGLIIATSYLLLAEYGLGSVPFAVGALVLAVVASNVALHWVPEYRFRSAAFTGAVIVVDTIGVTAALLYTGKAGAEFFFVYFFVLFLAAIGESLPLIALGAVVVAVGYLVAMSNGDLASVLHSAQLVRVPFLLMAASFYGYLVNRLRAESRRRALTERTAGRLEAARQELADKAARLEETSARLREEVVERKEAEKELEHANHELHELSARKSDFISAVSHELRTPLTSIRNAADLLRTGRLGELTPPQLRFVEMARRNTRRLSEIIDDLLDISRIEAGRQAFRFAKVDAGELVETVCESFVGRIDSEAPELVVERADGLPKVWIDPQRIEQVVTNLISNAFKFTPARGRVTVAVRPEGDGVEIRVSDTGIGIPAEEQERIFHRFYQVEDPLTRHCKGTGLGLSIVQRLLAAHGVTISVDSAPGSGSSFYFTLPRATPQSAESSQFEQSFLKYRSQAHFFSLLVIRPLSTNGGEGEEERAEALELLRQRVRELLPRTSDEVIKQEGAERLIVALVGTLKDGAQVVQRKLRTALEEDRRAGAGVSGSVLDCASFPEDGSSGAELLSRIDQTA